MNTLPPWRRWLLLCALLILGFLYIAAFLVFRRDSRNFLDTVEERRARAYAVAQPLRQFPQQFVFHKGNAETGLLGAGWWPAGADGAALVRSPAQLQLALPPPQRDLRLAFTLDAYVPAPGASVRVTAHGRELAHWSVGDQPRLENTELILPAALQRHGLVELELHLQGPREAWKGARAAKPGAEIFLLLRDLQIHDDAAPRG